MVEHTVPRSRLPRRRPVLARLRQVLRATTKPSGEYCLCSPAELGSWHGSKGWPAHARRPRHQTWVRAQAGNQRRLSPEACQQQPEFQRSAAAGSEAAAGPAEQAQCKLFMAAAASEAAQQHAAAAEQAEKHEMHVLSTYSMASHAWLSPLSRRVKNSATSTTPPRSRISIGAHAAERQPSWTVWGGNVCGARAAVATTVAIISHKPTVRCGAANPGSQSVQAPIAYHTIEVDPNRTRSGPASWAGRPKWIRSRSEVDQYPVWVRFAFGRTSGPPVRLRLTSTHFGPLQSPTSSDCTVSH